MLVRFCSIVLSSVLILSCAGRRNPVNELGHLRLLSEYRISNEQVYQNSLVGGLSGIDYNSRDDEYYLISDDRSTAAPARFYTAKIRLNDKMIDTLWFTAVSYLHNPQQKIYPAFTADTFHSCDPEGIRFNVQKNEWTWCSEGLRFTGPGASYLRDPWIYNMTREGGFIDSFKIPSNMHVSANEKGPRRNSAFEGLSFADEGRTLYASLEEPIYEDGPQAASGDSAAWTRIVKFDTRTRMPVTQYAYRLDPVKSVPVPAGAFKINGISDVLGIDKHRLLVIERSFSTGTARTTIKVFLADLRKATNVDGISSLRSGNFTPVSKKLLLDMDSLGIHIDNIEGVCIGPKLPGGKQSLLFISDNNFQKDQVTQLLLFQIN